MEVSAKQKYHSENRDPVLMKIIQDWMREEKTSSYALHDRIVSLVKGEFPEEEIKGLLADTNVCGRDAHVWMTEGLMGRFKRLWEGDHIAVVREKVEQEPISERPLLCFGSGLPHPFIAKETSFIAPPEPQPPKVSCQTCGGRGVVDGDFYDDEGNPIQGADNCPTCNGTEKIVDRPFLRRYASVHNAEERSGVERRKV